MPQLVSAKQEIVVEHVWDKIQIHRVDNGFLVSANDSVTTKHFVATDNLDLHALMCELFPESEDDPDDDSEDDPDDDSDDDDDEVYEVPPVPVAEATHANAVRSGSGPLLNGAPATNNSPYGVPHALGKRPCHSGHSE